MSSLHVCPASGAPCWPEVPGLTELMWRHLVLSHTFLSRGEGNAQF